MTNQPSTDRLQKPGRFFTPARWQEIATFALDLEGQSGIMTDPANVQASARFQAMLLRSPATGFWT